MALQASLVPYSRTRQSFGMYVVAYKVVSLTDSCDTAIPNIYAVHTVTLIKASMALNKSLPPERTSLLNVLLQVNTSGEDTKSDLTPLSSPESSSSEPVQLVRQSSQSVLGFTGTYDYQIAGRVAHLVKM